MLMISGDKWLLEKSEGTPTTATASQGKLTSKSEEPASREWKGGGMQACGKEGDQGWQRK